MFTTWCTGREAGGGVSVLGSSVGGGTRRGSVGEESAAPSAAAPAAAATSPATLPGPTTLSVTGPRGAWKVVSVTAPSAHNPGAPVVIPRDKYAFISKTAFTTCGEEEESEAGDDDVAASSIVAPPEQTADAMAPLPLTRIPSQKYATEPRQLHVAPDPDIVTDPTDRGVAVEVKPTSVFAEPETASRSPSIARSPSARTASVHSDEAPTSPPAAPETQKSEESQKKSTTQEPGEPEQEEEVAPPPEVPRKVPPKSAPKSPAAKKSAPKKSAAKKPAPKWKVGGGKKAASPKLGQLPKAAQSVGGPGGLTTRDRSKLVDMADPSDDKWIYLATQFARVKINMEPEEEPEVSQRDRMFVLWFFLYALKLARQEKQHPVATACTHVCERASGMMISKQSKLEGSQVQFLALRVARPVLEALEKPEEQSMGLKELGEDIKENIRVMMGEKPAGVTLRVDYVPEIITSWSWTKGVEMVPGEFDKLVEDVHDALDENRTGGYTFVEVMKRVEQALSA